MPAILTHDFFGRDAYPEVAAQFGFESLDEFDAFLLGNQGPDPLFYLVADPFADERNRVGLLMHCARPAKLLCSLRDALSMLSHSERRVGEAYAAGFVCHYLLDRLVHPLVYASEFEICDAGVEGLDRSDASEVHAEIERELDEMVLFSKTGKTVSRYRPYREVLSASDETLATVDKLFFYMGLWTYSRTLDRDCFSRAVRSFRRMQRLFFSPRMGKARVLASIERTLGHKRYSLLAAMAHRPRAEKVSAFDNHMHGTWVDPFTDEGRTESFWDLYEEALGQVFDAEAAFFSLGFSDGEALELTGGLNFNGRPTDPDDLEGPGEFPDEPSASGGATKRW
jgi:hypothetical protein